MWNRQSFLFWDHSLSMILFFLLWNHDPLILMPLCYTPPPICWVSGLLSMPHYRLQIYLFPPLFPRLLKLINHNLYSIIILKWICWPVERNFIHYIIPWPIILNLPPLRSSCDYTSSSRCWKIQCLHYYQPLVGTYLVLAINRFECIFSISERFRK